jgi:hypothetical protein
MHTFTSAGTHGTVGQVSSSGPSNPNSTLLPSVFDPCPFKVLSEFACTAEESKNMQMTVRITGRSWRCVVIDGYSSQMQRSELKQSVSDLFGLEAVPAARVADLSLPRWAYGKWNYAMLADPSLQEGSLLELEIGENGGVREGRKRLEDLNERVRELEVHVSRFEKDIEWPKFSEEEDDREVIDALFNAIDSDGSDSVTVDELLEGLKGVDCDEEKAKILKGLLEGNSHESAKAISREEFRQHLCALPRVCGERVQWARTLKLDVELARFLKIGDVLDGLRGLKEMNANELEQHIAEVCRNFGSILPTLLRNNLRKLRSPDAKGGSTAQEYMNSKFSLDGAYVGRYATLEDFYKGPEALIGTPNPNIEKGMKAEHCYRTNAKEYFTTPNYNVLTYPQLEWEFVVEPKEGAEYPHTPSDKSMWKPDQIWSQKNPKGWKGDRGRDPIRLEAFLGGNAGIKGLDLFSSEDKARLDEARKEVKRAGLARSEVMGLRLYTGPLYVLYNAVLRGFPPGDVEILKGNKFETSIFVISSGITKLSKVTGIPENRRLYRGLGGMILPRQFWDKFEECQVTVRIEIERSGHPELMNVLQNRIISGGKLQEEGRADHTIYDIGGNFLVLPTLNMSAKGSGLIRMVKEPHAVGEAVIFLLRFPVSKYDFEDDLRNQFIADLQQICGKNCTVVIEEVINKPVDFRGGGTQPITPCQQQHMH